MSGVGRATRKEPKEIEFMIYYDPTDNIEEITEWMGCDYERVPCEGNSLGNKFIDYVTILTHRWPLFPGDYIILINGTHFVYKPEIFHETYTVI